VTLRAVGGAVSATCPKWTRSLRFPSLLLRTASIVRRSGIRMRFHRTLAVIVCCALLLARGLGLHAHVASHPEKRDVVTIGAHAHDHGGAHSAIVAFGDADHAERHLGHGDIDVDLPDTTFGKLPSMSLVLAFMFVALVILLPSAGVPSHGAAYRPPARRRWPRLLPPSQAPPFAS